MAESKEILAPSTILQNRYRVLRELGHGGMGTVYEALDQRINCLVALKETSAGNQNEARRAFEREASLLGNLRHSGLPKVMDYFSEGNADFLIMEFIPGHDLAHLLEAQGNPFPQDQVLLWSDEILKVLEYLHGQEPPILHRDIKPANLKLTTRGEIFLLDFGLAKGTAGQMQTLATSRSVYGYTPVYASLEQILGQGTDPRSDLYSVGATLYHLLTGVIPADAPKRFSLIQDEQPDPLQPIEKLNPKCTASVAAIIHQAMAINRRQRPAGAAEMRKALREAAEKDERSAAEADAAARATEERKRRQEAGTTELDKGFPEEVERQRREEEAARKVEAQRQAEAVRRAEDEGLRAKEEARSRGEQERRHVEAERQRIEAERRREREAGEAERPRVAERKQREDKSLPAAAAPAPTLSAVDSQRTVTAQTPVAPLPIRNKRAMLIAMVAMVALAAVAVVAGVAWLRPWGGQGADVVDNSNKVAVPAGNSNNAALPVGNSNKGPAPSPVQSARPPANRLTGNTPSKNSVKPDNANRASTTNSNVRRSAQTSNPPTGKTGKKGGDADAAERRRRARSILDRP